MSRNRLPLTAELRAQLADNPFVGRGRAYKFFHSRDQKLIFEELTIKIGRTRQFRVIEKATLQDRNEGTSITGYDDQPVRLRDIHPSHAIHSILPASGAGLDSTIQAFSVVQEQPDVFAYCFTYERTKAVVDSFMDDDPFDSVAEIPDVFALADFLVAENPVLRGMRYWCLPAIYRNVSRDYHEPAATFPETLFEKDLNFSENKEGRIVFIPTRNFDPKPLEKPWHHPGLKKLIRPCLMP
jgi:hypothetical protein